MPGLTLINGVLPVMSGRDMADMARAEAEAANNQAVVQGLAGHVRRCFSIAETAKQQTVEPRLLQCLRQRNGEYDPEKLTEIRKAGGSEIYMMLTSNKCRAAASWIKDVLLGTRGDRPWTLDPTTNPELTPDTLQALIQEAAAEAMEIEAGLGQGVVTPRHMQEIAAAVKDRAMAKLREEAATRAARMADKMEDQLQEGGFHVALNAFVNDLVTFPFAVIKGPVVRNRPQLAWSRAGQADYQLSVENKLVLEWERVDPFMLYWQPNSAGVDDGYLIERHHLTRSALEALRGVAGYDENAIIAVLDEYGRGGLRDWLYVDTAKALAEGKSTSAVQSDVDQPIDALQFWGEVQGKMLIEWGMDEADVPDPVREYPCEVWVVGRWVIKATVNTDPLGRKPYYKACYEQVPGAWAGNGVPDLIRDCQDICNAAARALHNNMGLSSGPQVWVNVDRMPAGENITSMYPWKIWQGRSDPYGNAASQAPFGFFQPDSHAQELMGIYERFSVLADEYSNIPRYMAGSTENSGGALRTSSGMSMLMSNAGKSIKNVVADIDVAIFTPLLERQYFYNMLYGEDPEMKGDVRIVARGANSLIVKEQAQVRRNEFFSIVASSPVVMDIVGKERMTELLREVARPLDMDIDRVVPSREEMRARLAAEQQMAMLVAQAGAQPGGEPTPGRGMMPRNGQQMQTGEPVVDNFAPPRR